MSEWLHIRTTNDTNGNPRRLWVEIEDGNTVRVIEEGYHGERFARGAGMRNYLTIDVQPSEYREFKRTTAYEEH